MAKSKPLPSCPTPSPGEPSLMGGLAGLLILAAVGFAYANSLHGQFVFDDVTTIRDNPDIRELWPLWRVLEPAHVAGLTSSGRPLVGLSLAVNYALGGNHVEGYHAFNLGIHLLASLVLCGLVRRTLMVWRDRALAGRADLVPSPLGFAVAVALVWAVHPLQTEAVTYVVQRAEAMMALFYLLTLYAFVRYVGSRSAAARIAWGSLSVAACLLGMGSKEVMVSAPLAAWVLDRVFMSGSFAGSWRRHRGVLTGLAATWLFLAYEVAITGNRAGTAGYGAHVAWWKYALTQSVALLRYLKLSLWPHPLVFDYGTRLETDWAVIIPALIVSLALVAAIAWACWRRPVLGFPGFLFLALLAPTTSVVPVATQVMAEHRMYLPLAAVVATVAWFLWRIARTTLASIGTRRIVLAGLTVGAVVGLGLATRARNADYRTDESLWRSAVEAYPSNARSHCNLGYVLGTEGRVDESMEQFQAALRLDPAYADAENNLGGAYFQKGELATSVEHFRNALTLNPNLASAHYNLGGSLVRMNQVEEGMNEFKEALRLDPNSPEAHYDLATSLAALRRFDEAIAEFGEALRIRPDYTEAMNNLATAKLETGRPEEAAALYRKVLELEPGSAVAHFDLANILGRSGQFDEALVHYHQAIALRPDYAKAHCNLGTTLVQMGKLAEAVAEYRLALQYDPNLGDARMNLERVEAYLRGH